MPTNTNYYDITPMHNCEGRSALARYGFAQPAIASSRVNAFVVTAAHRSVLLYGRRCDLLSHPDGCWSDRIEIVSKHYPIMPRVTTMRT
jgi:hypothetical protein